MPYKFLTFLVMLYFTIMIITVVMIYKIDLVGTIPLSASSLVIPFWYCLADIIAEVYGYKISRQLIWSALVCESIFIFLCFGLVLISSPISDQFSEAYNAIFLKLPRVFLGSVAAIFIGGFVNAYALTKWKALVKGRYFWLRSVGSTILGEAFFVLVAFMIEFLGRVPLGELINLMLVSYVIKVGFAPILAVPASFFCNYLKKKECIDIYDNQMSFTPAHIFIK